MLGRSNSKNKDGTVEKTMARTRKFKKVCITGGVCYEVRLGRQARARLPRTRRALLRTRTIKLKSSGKSMVGVSLEDDTSTISETLLQFHGSHIS